MRRLPGGPQPFLHQVGQKALHRRAAAGAQNRQAADEDVPVTGIEQRGGIGKHAVKEPRPLRHKAGQILPLRRGNHAHPPVDKAQQRLTVAPPQKQQLSPASVAQHRRGKGRLPARHAAYGQARILRPGVRK